MKKSTTSAPARRHYLDKRADQIASLVDVSNDEALLPTQAVATWLGLSTTWLEIGRVKGYGPSFKRISTRCVRYRVGDVRQWLKERAYASTAPYFDTKRSERAKATWNKKRAEKSAEDGAR